MAASVLTVDLHADTAVSSAPDWANSQGSHNPDAQGMLPRPPSTRGPAADSGGGDTHRNISNNASSASPGSAHHSTMSGAGRGSHGQPLPHSAAPPLGRSSSDKGGSHKTSASDHAPCGRRSLASVLPAARGGAATHLAAGRSSFSRQRRPRGGGRDRTTRENFFYYGETAPAIGVGTVGLHAAKATPVYVYHAKTADGSGNESAVEVVRNFYTTACYTSPPNGVPMQWELKEREYTDWRSRQLKRSLYYTYVTGGPGSGNEGVVAAASGEGAGLDSLPVSADPKSLYTPEELQRFERQRLTAIARVRHARESERQRQSSQRQNDLLDRRRRKLRGEAVDLPDAYYSVVLAQQSATPGSAADRNHITTSDHHRAQAMLRQQRQAQREQLEEERRERAQRMRKRISAQLQESRNELAAHKEAMLKGVLRTSRAAVATRTETQEEQQRHIASVYRAERDATRDVYSQYWQQQAEEIEARQRELRQHIKKPLSAVPAHTDNADEATRPTSAHKPTATRAAATAPAAADSKAVALGSPEPGAGNPNSVFLTEIKQWQDTFHSPNCPPVNAEDAQVRRDWLRELAEERRQFNDHSVQLAKDMPVRIQQSRGDCYEQRCQAAEVERGAKSAMLQRREEIASANRRHVELCHDAQRGQAQRAREARVKQNDGNRVAAEVQRQTEKFNDALLNTIEAEELRALRESVQTGRR